MSNQIPFTNEKLRCKNKHLWEITYRYVEKFSHPFQRELTPSKRIYFAWHSGPGCSTLTTSLVNVSLKFQMLISQIRQYFLLKKCEKLELLTFFQQKISVYLALNELVKLTML